MGSERHVKQGVYEMFKAPQRGDLLMNAPETHSWKSLCKNAANKEYWRTRVREMRQPRIVAHGPEMVEGGWAPFTIND